eukprot:7266451-Prymnesium_polylepis.1
MRTSRICCADRGVGPPASCRRTVPSAAGSAASRRSASPIAFHQMRSSETDDACSSSTRPVVLTLRHLGRASCVVTSVEDSSGSEPAGLAL